MQVMPWQIVSFPFGRRVALSVCGYVWQKAALPIFGMLKSSSQLVVFPGAKKKCWTPAPAAGIVMAKPIATASTATTVQRILIRRER